ncbi:hypothetical protein BH18ACT15_BH18ACT15_00630 [soil metagenome]
MKHAHTRRLWVAGVSVVALWGAMTTLGYVQQQADRERARKLVEVPTVVGWRLGPADRLLDSLGLSVSVVRRLDGYADEGSLILDQHPAQGTRVPTGAKVSVAVLRRGVAIWRRRIPLGGVRTFHPATRGALLRRLRDAGFLESLVLPGARASRVKVFAVGHVRTITTYPRGQGKVEVSQSNGLEPAYGRQTTVRGRQGVEQDDAFLWTERGYRFRLSPARHAVVGSLRWVTLP